MSPAVAIIFRAAGILAVVIVVGFVTVLVVGGTVGIRISRWRDRREPTTEVSTWEALTQPDWDADRPQLIWVSSHLLLDWLLQFGGAAEEDAVVGIDMAIPNATIRYVYADKQVIDVTASVLVARDVVPEWSAGPRAWASDADIDGHTYTEPPLPEADRWVVPTSTVLGATPVEEIRADLAELPEAACIHVKVSGTAVWDWLRDASGVPDEAVAETVRAGGLTVWVDSDLPDHTVRFVYADDTIVDRDVTGGVIAWQLRQAEIAQLAQPEPDEIAAAQAYGVVARMAQPEVERQTWPWSDPNTEVTEPVEHATPRERLAEVADNVDRHLGIDRDLPQWADTDDHGPRTVSHWDQPRIAPAQRVNGSES